MRKTSKKASLRDIHNQEFRRKTGFLILVGFLFFLVTLSLPYWHIEAMVSLNSRVQLASDEMKCNTPFVIEETLMLPNKNGVSLVMSPKQATELFIEYGEFGKKYDHKTEVQVVEANEVAKFTIDDLRPDGAYSYRVLCRAAGSNTRFSPRESHTFKTLRGENRTFSFGYATDAHFYDLWSTATFGGTAGTGYKFFKQGMQNLKGSGVDFIIFGGDNAYTHCPSCPGGTIDGVVYEPNYAVTIPQAELRYQTWLAPEHIGVVTPAIPFVYVLGNHEGETNPNTNQCDHSTANSVASLAARQKYYANPQSVYGGNPEGSYYSFETGDALIVVLDVMRYSQGLPFDATGWTLGDEQLAWFENTLKNSNRKWKFIIAEHLLGGEKIPILHCYHYGRASMRATDNNLLTGTFKGQQAELQAWMEAHTTPGGATFFMSGHDHLAMIPTEKPNIDGAGTNVYYLTGGTIGALAGNNWKNAPAFQVEMDWDYDGIADYYSDTIGTLKRGYYHITIDGKDAVHFDYILSDINDETLNNTVLFSKSINAE
jgi:hypothetical protein